jgi:hypothetical protein
MGSRSQGRGNGRFAASYAPLVDLDPQVADAVLEVLGDAGIAAYAVPVFDHRALSELPARMVDRPLDRVYVDAGQAERARPLVEACLPEVIADLEVSGPAMSRVSEPLAPLEGGIDEDAAWAGIVAGFDEVTTDPVPRWPVAEDADTTDAAEGRDTGRADSRDGADEVHGPDLTTYAGASPASTWRAPAERAPGADDAEEHFVPPPPPPLHLPTDPIARAAWVGLIGGPLLIIVAALLGWTLSGWVGVLAAGGFVGGFVTLIARMKEQPPDSGDNGAVV